MRFGRHVRDRAPRPRDAATVAERAAWALLRSRRVLGYKFKRQYSVGGVYFQFYCPELKLALEIEGTAHEASQPADAPRGALLEAEGIRIVRIPNDAVSRTTFEEIVREHTARSPA